MNSASRSIRKPREQSMGYWLSEPALLDLRKVEEGMKELAAAGYDLVRIMLRNTNFTHRSPEVIEAVRLAVRVAHAKGMKVALDCEPHADPIGRDMGAQFPEAMSTMLVPARVNIVNGTFALKIRTPRSQARMPVYSGVEAAFVCRNGKVRKLDNLDVSLRWELDYYDDWTAEQDYLPGVKGYRGRTAKLIGKLDAEPGSELMAYIRLADSRKCDFWSEGARRYYEMVLECYRDIPLDGIGWDEPAFGGSWAAYWYGAAYARSFEAINGYKLADWLWLLDEQDLSPEAVRVRLDYYHTLNEGVLRAQQAVAERARSLFGEGIILGTHHTWRGEGSSDDYRAGAVDYFRLNDTMDAGYTDCCWWDMESVCYSYVLGSSLGRLTPSGEAECNTWHWKPTNALVEYHSRLMTLMDINWFNIWYGEDSDTCMYPAHYTWDATVSAMQRQRKCQRRLGAAKPVAEIAIWHGWEGVTAMNSQVMASAHKAFCLNTARLLVERSIAFDFVDSRLLENAECEDGCLATALGRYRVLVMPYATVLPRKAWDRCAAFAKAGGKVIFVGTPPVFDTKGMPLARDFAAWMDMPGLPLEEYLSVLDAYDPLSVDRAGKLDVSYPLSGETSRLLISSENEPHGIWSPDGNTLFLTDLDPRLRLVRLLEELIEPEVECFSDSILWRLYRDEERSILVCIAARDREMRGIIRFMGEELEIGQGRLALIEVNNGRFEVLGEDLIWHRKSSARNGTSEISASPRNLVEYVT